MTERSETLLDSNVLVALAIDRHEHHEDAERWLGTARFATCPITQGALIRIVAQYPGGSIARAAQYLKSVTESDRHEFWPDEISYVEVPLRGIVGHKQVTDAYLAHLARTRSARLATLDRALAELHSDVVDLVPTT